MKTIIPFLLFMLLTISSYGQITTQGEDITTSTISSKQLVAKRKNKTITIPQHEIIEVFVKSSNHKIKGKLIILNDSTIELNHVSIPLSDIIKIKMSAKTRGLGIALSVLNSTLLAGSVVSFYNMSNSSQFLEAVIFGFLGTVTGLAGIVTFTPAILLVSNSGKEYYNSEKWTFEIE